jgi:hypothetical protein
VFKKKFNGMNIPIEIKQSLHFIGEKIPNIIIKLLNIKPEVSFDNCKNNSGVKTRKVLLYSSNSILKLNKLVIILKNSTSG